MPFNEQRAQEPIAFMEMLHLTDDFYGQPFKLQPWQSEIIKEVYGRTNERGYRQYTYSYLEIPKKNGKTTTIAGLGLYHLVCDGHGGQIYCCAADREQASLTYNCAVQMIEQDEELGKILKITESKKLITNSITGTFMKVLSAEAYTKHGINPTVVIFDELHAQPNRDLWDVMTFGAGAARKETLYWIITTAGDDPDRASIGWEIHEKARKISIGEIDNPYWYVKMYGIPSGLKLEQIMDEALWYEVNPSLGVAIDISKVRLEAAEAMSSPADEKKFRWLRLNEWVNLKATGWLPLTAWDATQAEWTIEDLHGLECYGGLDLATTWDMNGFCLLFPPQKSYKKWRVIFEAWIPEDNMKERVRRDGVAYDDWVREGYIFTTPGNVTDYAYIRERILEHSRVFKIKEIGYDQHNATQLSLELASKKIKMVPVSQTILGMSSAAKQVEVLFKSGEIEHNENPAARWCFGNVHVYMDGNENYKMIKDSRTDRVDLMFALVDAMSRALPNILVKSIYSERGMRVL